MSGGDCTSPPPPPLAITITFGSLDCSPDTLDGFRERLPQNSPPIGEDGPPAPPISKAAINMAPPYSLILF
ncbi:hypothetical protein EVAR_101760_1 [Eumeta japonica]|uniref:Uncharacterized protein n=1 Tax=Eumeta variegata TaxID=151549 RepID=A0A4C1SQ97_EUMVA|nr:hypothetical protein EVAR_101760_1 [Eumeta japonica]